MSKSLLITRPNHDITTNYLYFWSEKIIEQAKNSMFKVIDLQKKRANKKEFTGVITKTEPPLVILNGHGDSNTVTGIDNEPLVQLNDNEFLLKDKITYAISCSSGKGLGASCVKNQAKAYLGYSDEFIFIIDETKITRPLQDNTAKLFLEPSNQVAISLIKGATAGVAHKKSKDLFRKTIRDLLTSESPESDKDAVPFLVWNLQHQVCLGDTDAKV